MKKIPLSILKKNPKYKGLFALVDDEDYEELSKYNWHIKIGKSGIKYAATNICNERGKRLMLRMHNLITGFKMCDHKDRDGLNNQKINLRECTHAQNMANRRYHNKTGYKGVYKIKNIDGIEYYQAKIKVGKKDIYLGSSYDKKKLAILYNDAAVKYFGEFARLNIID